MRRGQVMVLAAVASVIGLAGRPSGAAIAESEYVKAINSVRKKLGAQALVIKSPPFVVTGDLSRAELESYTRRIVTWSVRLLRQDFFQTAPQQVITIYLFRTDKSYRAHALRLFGHRPSTPYGYYLPSQRAMIMNIATGGGTLVHEIVHPLLRTDFPAAPAWFDEGMGSLFEACSEHKGHIIGLKNWRLKGLLAAMAKGELVPLEKVMRTSTDAFYNDDESSLYYAEARYFLMYLQHKGLLREYYRRFRSRHAEDGTGIKFVREILAGQSLAAIERQWVRWVKTL